MIPTPARCVVKLGRTFSHDLSLGIFFPRPVFFTPIKGDRIGMDYSAKLSLIPVGTFFSGGQRTF